MVGPPGPLRELDRYFAAATIAHEYIADLHRELVALGGDDERTRELLSESAGVVGKQMPELIRDLRRLEREWGEQELLDPQQAESTLDAIAVNLAEVVPKLSTVRARQDEIAAELGEHIERARRH